MENIGKLILSLGVVLVIVGLGLWLFEDKLGWLGNLPGDIKIERPGFTFYFPVTTMVLISIALSAVMWLIGMITRLAR
jgi:hypothetical protein